MNSLLFVRLKKFTLSVSVHNRYSTSISLWSTYNARDLNPTFLFKNVVTCEKVIRADAKIPRVFGVRTSAAPHEKIWTRKSGEKMNFQPEFDVPKILQVSRKGWKVSLINRWARQFLQRRIILSENSLLLYRIASARQIFASFEIKFYSSCGSHYTINYNTDTSKLLVSCKTKLATVWICSFRSVFSPTETSKFTVKDHKFWILTYFISVSERRYSSINNGASKYSDNFFGSVECKRNIWYLRWVVCFSIIDAKLITGCCKRKLF